MRKKSARDEEEVLRDLWSQWHLRKNSGRRWGFIKKDQFVVPDGVEEISKRLIAPDLLVMLLFGDSLIRKTLKPIVERVFKGLSPNDYAFVEEQSRHLFWYQSGNYDPVDLLEDPFLKAWIGTTHANGRIRESSLQLLPDLDPHDSVALSLLRINDWVDPIREQAMAIARESIGKLNNDELLSLLPLFRRLRERGRHQFHEELEEIFGKAIQEVSWDEWISCYWSIDKKDRRYLSRVVRLWTREIPFSVCKAFLADQDRSSVIWIIRNREERLSPETFEKFRAILVQSKSGAIVATYLRSILESNEDFAPDELRAALVSPSGAVRSIARYYLSDIGPEEIEEICLKKIESNLKPWIGLRSLSEVNPVKADKIARTQLYAERIAMRKSAIEVLKLDEPPCLIDELLELLKGDEVGVAKSATAKLIEYRDRVSVSHLTVWLEKNVPESGARNYLWTIAMHYPRWDSLEICLSLFDSKVKDQLTLESVVDWEQRKLGSSWLSIGKEQQMRLGEKLARSKCSPNVSDRVEEMIDRWSS